MIYKKIFLLAILLLLVSCSSSRIFKEESKYSGVGGLEVEIDYSSLRQTFYSKSPTSLRFVISNTGAFDIQNGKVVVGTERELLNPSNSNGQMNVNLEGKDEILLDGETVEVDMDFNIGPIFAAESQSTDIRVNYCYAYKTHFSTTVCVQYDKDQDDLPDGCPPDFEYFSGQGSPIAITSIEPVYIPSGNGVKPQFIFEIENLMSGTVVDVTQYQKACSSSSIDKDIRIVKVLDFYLGNQRLTCSASQLKLDKRQESNEFVDSKVAKLICTGPVMYGDAAYTTSLRGTLEYGYMDRFEETILVEKLPDYS